MKYIVKNCPCFLSKLFNWQQKEDNECLCTNSPEDVNLEMQKCENITDCSIKQVIELVKGGNPFLTEKVLNTLQVEEVE